MKKILITFLVLAFLSTPLLMWPMYKEDSQAKQAVICVSDCFEETALTKSRLADLHDLDILPAPPVALLPTISFSVALIFLYPLLQVSLRKDYQSLHCSYLE